MTAVRSVKVPERGTLSSYIVVTLVDGDELPLGGPRWTHVYDENATATDNHLDAAEAFAVYRLGMRRPHAENGRHLGYGSYRFDVVDHAENPTNPDLWKD